MPSRDRQIRHGLRFKPSLPTTAPRPPAGPDRLHEIKHGGFGMLALREGERVRLPPHGGALASTAYGIG
jgi:hypothetical protein